MTKPNAQNDHDLLIRVDTKVDSLKDDIKDIKDGTATKIADHEQRIVSLESEKTRVTVLLMVGGSLLTFLVGLLVFHLFQA